MVSWLRFANLQLPPRLANALIERFGTPDAVFGASQSDLDGIQGLSAKQADRLADPTFLPTQAQVSYLATARIRVVPRGDAYYPRGLAELPDAPPVLFVRGNLDEKDRFAVALVGTRQASPYGRSVTAKFARDLCNAGITVVSGGALGIDSAAHRAATEARGRTLVVLGCGLDVRYPMENQRLFDRIVEDELGAVLTEFPLGATPEPWRFPMRNRVISALSMAVVVVEADVQSGAIITATIAAEQGREVMAVPGNIDRPLSRGANALIRDGATLVTDARDILDALGMLTLEMPTAKATAPPRRVAELPAAQQGLLDCLSLTPKHMDAIAAEVHMAPAEAGVQMTMLELAGLARRLPGNNYVRVL